MRAFVATVALALSSVACGAAAQTEEGFSSEMLARFAKAYPQNRFEISEPLTLVRDKGADAETVINLHRIWLYCKNVPAECDRLQHEYIAKANYPDLPPPKASQLRIIVRDLEYVSYLRSLEGKGDPGKPAPKNVIEPIGDDLFAIIAADEGDKIALVTEEQIADFGLNRAKAFSIAMQQTRSNFGEFPKPEVFASQGAGFETREYGSALLFDREAWAKIADAVGPDLFVTVVSDQFVFAGKIADGTKLDGFRKSVEEDCAQQERCVSPNIYRFRNGRWVIAK
jgi:hypothetical protein